MKPVKQEFLHQPEIGQHGDCMRAVIASLLELPIQEVPHFLHDGCEASVFWGRLNAFLSKFGYCYLAVPAFDMQAYLDANGIEEIWHEIGGPSPRGNDVFHAVVGRNGEIAHDPHPSQSGLTGSNADWTFGLLIRAGHCQ